MGFLEEHCSYAPAMAGWFLFSALLSSVNKAVFSWLTNNMYPYETGRDRITTMNWYTWFTISVPCAIVTSLDVGLSNLSMVTISITFYTMVKSSTPIFVLFWAYMFGLEKITSTLFLVVFIIAIGELLTVVGEHGGKTDNDDADMEDLKTAINMLTEGTTAEGIGDTQQEAEEGSGTAASTASPSSFHLHGFLLCLSASFLSGARWTLVQMKIQSLVPPLKTVFATMRLLAPSMFVSLFLIALILERPYQRLQTIDHEQLPTVLLMGCLAAVLAICMILCEFYLIMYASAMILMIGGVLKELVTIFVGIMFFHDTINRMNITGCVVVFSGVLLYKYHYHMEKQKQQHQQQQQHYYYSDQDQEEIDEQHDQQPFDQQQQRHQQPLDQQQQLLQKNILSKSSYHDVGEDTAEATKNAFSPSSAADDIASPPEERIIMNVSDVSSSRVGGTKIRITKRS